MALGKSHQVALNRFLQLERRYQRDPDKLIRYKEGIEEYFELGQITPAVSSERSTVSTSTKPCRVESCVLPHHAVYKEDSFTTKQRSVFVASAKTSNGRSLNDVLSIGPTLQNDLPAVLLNWRQCRHVFTADIQRMYRCIDVHPDDMQYQRILWREADGNIKEYCLSTVTFGTASAPFTAIRVIPQLAEDERENYPVADTIFFLVITLSSNDIALLDSIPSSNRCNQTSQSCDSSYTVKTLGMHWLPNQDCFTYKLQASIPTAKLVLKEVTMAHLHSESTQYQVPSPLHTGRTPLSFSTGSKDMLLDGKRSSPIALPTFWTTAIKTNGDMFPRRIIQKTAPREDYPHHKSPSLISGGTDHHGLGNTPRHFFTELVIQNSHQATLHGGAHLTLAHTRYKFWIPNVRQAVRTILRKCITCFRASPSIGSQLMGDLPVPRVNPPNRPFIATGVDYTGAIEIKAARLRGTSTYKGYIAIFVCLATKAVHLEAVTGLSSEHFQLAFSRFTGRRGPVQHMYSDNGTNFVGANKLLACAPQADHDHATCPTWHFTPPYSPNFGGLWEAGVKSIKHHVKRIVGSHKQTYEELATVLIRIEACLNCRPLCPLTADPDDLEALTPAHFLIGDTLLAPAHCRPQNSSFPRPKWSQERENFEINELVLIKDDQLPSIAMDVR
ncbi:uncharacterized protein [Drosophila suzukii]|uniref:Integrase catalytic domain-containing protein n=1 Tax=Drosophila suzukii TaxID=28584 RepID=A0ABM4TZK6_DROSZ